MSRFAEFIKGLTSPVTSDGGDAGATEREKRHRERSRRRRRFNSPDTVEKQEVDRKGTTSNDLGQSVKNSGAEKKPYDAVFLRDISANAVVQAYIDTLAQDVAGANWNIVPRDEDADLSEQELAKVERKLKDLPPESSFRDVIESTVRILLELGDATWLKFYEKNTGELAEVVPVDSASMFKKVDQYGITDGYVQVSLRGGQVEEEFDPREVVWFEWSTRPDRHYGQGPLEKAANEVELLEELAEKERLDLMQGSPPGIVSPSAMDEFGGLPNDDDWETFVEKFRLEEGERHRVGYSKLPVDFTPLNNNYQELQILDRSKYWVTVLGAVFKVNPSYAGFDFENTNRSTDESQQEAYAQRGFRITLRQVEESINRGLIWEEISDEIRFEFEREQTVDEQKSRAELIQTQAEAGKQMVNAGRDVTYRDGSLVVDDGELEEGDAGGGSGGGGFFGSVDGGDSGNPNSAPERKEDGLTKDQVAKLDEVLLRAHKRQIQPESLDDIEKRAWSGDESVPEFVINQIQEVIDEGAIFESFESLPGRVQDKVESILSESLTNPNGWSLDSIVENLNDAFPGVDKDKLEVVARTESASVLNEAREEGYQERDLADAKFYWQGPSDSRTTEACEELKELTNPKYGGEPVALPKLVELERQVHDEYFDRLSFRKHTIHPNERHTFVRDSGTGVDDVDTSDVDVPTAEEMNERFEEDPDSLAVPPRDES